MKVGPGRDFGRRAASNESLILHRPACPTWLDKPTVPSGGHPVSLLLCSARQAHYATSVHHHRHHDRLCSLFTCCDVVRQLPLPAPCVSPSLSSSPQAHRPSDSPGFRQPPGQATRTALIAQPEPNKRHAPRTVDSTTSTRNVHRQATIVERGIENIAFLAFLLNLTS